MDFNKLLYDKYININITQLKRDKMEALLQKLGENIGYVLIPIIMVFLVWLKDILDKFIIKRKKTKELRLISNFKQDAHINEILTEFRLLTNACRSSVIQFHNGDYFYNGSPILRFSMTHESCYMGIKRNINQIQNYYLSAYYQLIELVEKPFNIYETLLLNESNFKGLMEFNNTINFVLLPIKCPKNVNIIGLILLEWCVLHKSESIDRIEIKKICEKYVRLIKNIINNKNNE